MTQVQKLAELGLIEPSFIDIDSTPIMANTSQNNPKSFRKNKFAKENQPKSDPDCALGVHTATNQINERNYEFYWGYKNHILIDCITGLPIAEITTPANEADSAVVEKLLAKANAYLKLEGCTFIGDKGYDVNAIYELIRGKYHGECVIPLNKRNTKNPKKLSSGHSICEAGLAMHKDGKFTDSRRTRQKYCCPFKRSKSGSCRCNHKNWTTEGNAVDAQNT